MCKPFNVTFGQGYDTYVVNRSKHNYDQLFYAALHSVQNYDFPCYHSAINKRIN